MNYQGRFHQVRFLDLAATQWDCLGPPYILDRAKRTFEPVWQHPEWQERLERTWPRYSRYDAFGVRERIAATGFSATQQHPQVYLPFVGNPGAVTATNIGLDSNYVAGTGGDAVGARLVLRQNETLNKIYYFISSFTGTAANVNDIDLELRTGTSTAPGTTAPDLLETSAHNPASTTGWNLDTTFATAVTAGTIYWISCGDADGNITDFANVLRDHDANANSVGAMPWQQAFTTNGWTTVSRTGSRLGAFVLVFASGRVFGCPISAAGVTSTSNQLQKGILLATGFTEQIKLFGAIAGIGSNAFSVFNVFQGTDLPNATAFAAASHTIHESGGTVNGFLFGTIPTLAKATQYRGVFDSSTNNANPRRAQIGTGSTAELRAALVGGGNWSWTEETAGPVWTDNADEMPQIALIIEDQVAVAGGGGGGSRNLQVPGVIM